MGSAEAPLRLTVRPGTYDGAGPPPLPLWSFVTAAGVTTAIAGAAVGTGLGTLSVQDDYKTTAQAATDANPVSASTVQEKAALGGNLALATNVLLGSAAVALVATAVMVPFVNWNQDSPAVSE